MELQEFVGRTPRSAARRIKVLHTTKADEGVRPTIYAGVRPWENYPALTVEGP